MSAMPKSPSAVFHLAKRAVLLALAVAVPFSARAQRQENQDYSTATNLFGKGPAEQAERLLDNFVATYTNSPHWTNARLLQARARIAISNYPGALALLQPVPPGKFAPDFVFWTAKAYYGEGNYTNAIKSCADLIANYAVDPPLPLRAALLEAEAYSKLSDWANVIALLSQTNGVFQVAARASPSDADIVAGNFLLGGAFFNRAQYSEAQDVISKIATTSLTSELKWQRQYLLCQILLQLGQTTEALAGTTNLVTNLMTTSVQAVKTYFLLGEILEKAGQLDEATDAYSQNLVTNLPAPVNREAFQKIIAVRLRQNQSSNTMQWLGDFIKQRPGDPVLDLAYYYLGDLQLRSFFAAQVVSTNAQTPPDTNLLASAITNLGFVVAGFTNSEVLGQTHLDLGWCDWTSGKFAAAATHFSRAFDLLPRSEAQAVALFKLADSEYRGTNYPASVNHYNRLLQDYATMEKITNGLFELALYQLVQGNLQLGDTEAAQAAAQRLFQWFPNSSAGEQGLLLVGEDLSSRKASWAEARRILGQLLEKKPATSLWPEIQLATARTYEQEGDWTNALDKYTALENNTNFPTNLLPQLKYSLALACWKAGQDSNAFVRMTNVVFQFPGDSNAPLAKYWIGNYELDRGNAFNADIAFQELIKYYPNAGDLVWQARLMAGKSAFKNKDFANASNDFYVMVNDTNTPPQYLSQALFQFGYTLFQQFQSGSETNEALRSKLLDKAIPPLEQVATNSGPTNTLAALAAGQLGNAYFALANHRTNADDIATFCARATNWYHTALADTNDTPEDVAARNEAEFGLGLVAERLGQTNDALGWYCKILYDPDTAHADPVWIKNAGVKAAAIFEEQKKWTSARQVYQEVQRVVPSLADEMRKRMDRLPAGDK